MPTDSNASVYVNASKLYYFIGSVDTSWFGAFQVCASAGGWLSEFQYNSSTVCLNNVVGQLVKSLAKTSGYFWLSIFNPASVKAEVGVNATSNPFFYVDGTSLTNDALNTAGLANLQTGACSYLQPNWLATTVAKILMDTSNTCSMSAVNAVCQTREFTY